MSSISRFVRWVLTLTALGLCALLASTTGVASANSVQQPPPLILRSDAVGLALSQVSGMGGEVHSQSPVAGTQIPNGNAANLSPGGPGGPGGPEGQAAQAAGETGATGETRTTEETRGTRTTGETGAIEETGTTRETKTTDEARGTRVIKKITHPKKAKIARKVADTTR